VIIQLSVALIALAVTVLAIYAILTLRSAKTSLDQVNQTVQRLQLEMDEMSAEVKGLIHNTHQITADVNQKMKSMDAFFRSASEMGEAVHQISSSVKQVSASVSQTLESKTKSAVHTHSNKVNDAMEWVSIGMKVWQKLQGYRNAEKHQNLK
jgi:uncharacterized protein YoxC